MPFTSEEIRNLTRIALDQPPVWPEKKKLDGFRFTILLESDGYVYTAPFLLLEGSIDWGDGSKDDVTIVSPFSPQTHTYSNAGRYQIIIQGNLTAFCALNQDRIISVDTPFPSTMASFTGQSLPFYIGVFNTCVNLVSIPRHLFSACTGLQRAANCFENCSSLERIPGDIFSGCYNITTFIGCFRNCSSLLEVPSELFKECYYATTFESCFSGCISLQSIGSDVFYECWSVTNFKNCFSWCTSLTSIPEGLFYYLPVGYGQYRYAENFEGCFYYCSSLIEIPSGLFSGLYYATTFKECFSWCSSLTVLPNNLFYCPSNTTFEGCFYNCVSLTTVPSGIFGDCRMVQSFKECFIFCRSLSVLENIFGLATGAKDFSHCFSNSGVAGIPMTLFYNCDSAEDFSHCFEQCKQLTEIEYEWYHHKTNASAKDFSYCFYLCQSIKSITAHVFSGCTAAINFSHCFDNAFDIYDGCDIGSDAAIFYGCSSAEDFSYCFASCLIPAVYVGLFTGCVSAKNFSHCFDGRLGRYNEWGQLDDLFNACVNAEDFSYCFYECRFVFVDPNMFHNCQSITNLDYCFCRANIGNIPSSDPWARAPELWLTHASASHVSCFGACTHAKNYADIPSDWK